MVTGIPSIELQVKERKLIYNNRIEAGGDKRDSSRRNVEIVARNKDSKH